MGTTPQFIRFLRISLGSATELATHLELARDLSLAAPDQIDEAIQLCHKEIGLLIGLVFSLGRRLRSTRPSSHIPRPN